MIRIMGSEKVLCDGLSRRDLLQVGGLGAFGLELSDLFGLQELQASPAPHSAHFGRAKACILLFQFGSPPQHETFDPKPDAPAEIQGEMKAIPTSVPGISICEGLPNIAKIMDRLTVVRSLTHPFPNHGTAYAMTGIPFLDTSIEGKPRDKRQWPFIGSIVDYLEDQRSGGRPPEIPRNIALPFILGSETVYPPLAGPYGTFLGMRYDPIVTDFTNKGTKGLNPFMGIKPGAKIRLAEAATLRDGMTPQRFDLRRLLLRQFDHSRAWMESEERVQTYSWNQSVACSLLTSHKVHQALDVQRVPINIREQYGMTLFGQSCLAARRLVEAGCKFVTVFWDSFGSTGSEVALSSWDTHTQHFPRLKKFLLPVFDQTYPALILDLESRGLLDETLVLCMSEHGRTPRLNSSASRDHWSRAYSQVYAGAGMGRGNLVGRTDKIAADVTSTPVSPKDVLATTFYLLGIDPNTTVPNRLNQPKRVAGEGQLRPELLG